MFGGGGLRRLFAFVGRRESELLEAAGGVGADGGARGAFAAAARARVDDIHLVVRDGGPELHEVCGRRRPDPISFRI